MYKILAALLLCPALAWGQATVLGTGLVVKGQIGNFGGCAYGPARSNAIIEVDNCTLGTNLVVTLFQADPTGEAGIDFEGALANGHSFQQVGVYSRYVNNNNGSGWKGVLGIHVVGHDTGQGGDSTDALFYPANAVKLAAGPTTNAVHNYPPPPNTVELGAGNDTPAPVGVGILFHPRPTPAPRNDGGTLYMGMDGQMYIMMPTGIAKQIAP